MNQIKDIFNTQFFVILGVVLLLVTCLVLYVEQKFKAYDHKMSSMLSLVSSLAEEMDIFKNNSNHSGGQPVKQNEIQTEINNLNTDLEESKLIDVSDEEDNEDSDSDSESNDDNNLDSDSETGSDTDSETDMESVDDVNEPKVVNTLDIGSNENEIITITKLEDLQSNDIIDLVEEVNNIEQKYDLDELDELEDLDNSLDSSNDLDDLEEIEETNMVEELDDEIEETNMVEEPDDIEEINDDAIDYNKLSVAKLKEIALEKNLISNTSNKLKKAELLKLLEGI
jgi:hypothetical protein